MCGPTCDMMCACRANKPPKVEHLTSRMQCAHILVYQVFTLTVYTIFTGVHSRQNLKISQPLKKPQRSWGYSDGGEFISDVRFRSPFHPLFVFSSELGELGAFTQEFTAHASVHAGFPESMEFADV
uniref:Uncharacterized protein n=1 Tax=Eutreptiella gymnastica TaxID=73025 RepID=A0A7S1J3R5_9EUGL|mmetsp:Transcript_6492/g.11640  ORF Transcript_6492/g.11640 Transcript_6492/m.11640 type:complete len:126 (+) Transcript_6492:227-604(+)